MSQPAELPSSVPGSGRGGNGMECMEAYSSCDFAKPRDALEVALRCVAYGLASLDATEGVGVQNAN